MESRSYRSEKRENKARRTRSAVLKAARDLVATGLSGSPSVVAVAARAGVSRLTVYSHFGSKEGLLDALVAEARGADGPDRALDSGDPKQGLERILAEACTHWASDPSLFRRLPPIALGAGGEASDDRRLAERLAAVDELRPGCSIKEAEDVIALLRSFATFDRLHQDGRRSAAAVAGILMRLAAAILA
jgi:AcrR family transcriptional regulator